MRRYGAIHVGLTGGIGSGKSTVANMLRSLGATVVDADAISQAITGVHGVAIPEIESVFGAELVGADGALNRNRMRDIIFNDASAKARLESILHPLIRQEMLTDAAKAESQGSTCIVFDIPLLIESRKWRGAMDCVAVVDCSTETQQARVAERNGFSIAMIQRVITNQASRAERLRGADMILYNDGISMAQLAVNVKAFAPRIGL